MENQKLIDLSLILSILSTIFSLFSLLLSLYNIIKVFRITGGLVRRGYNILTQNDYEQ
jgi:hypothetical protein